MFAKVRSAMRSAEDPAIDMAPLIDMVFILLIFFLVTTSFTQETGIAVRKPKAKTATAQSKQSILVGITAQGAVHMNNQRIDIGNLRSLVEYALSEASDRPVILVADQDCRTGVLVRVMDICKLAGAKRISLAAKRD